MCNSIAGASNCGDGRGDIEEVGTDGGKCSRFSIHGIDIGTKANRLLLRSKRSPFGELGIGVVERASIALEWIQRISVDTDP